MYKLRSSLGQTGCCLFNHTVKSLFCPICSWDGWGSSLKRLFHERCQKIFMCFVLIGCFRSPKVRVFVNLWFGKPMVCLWVTLIKNDGSYENDEDNSDSHKQGVECCISENHGNPGIDENHGNPGCKPRFPKQRV